jgi:hypothetical protein
LGRRKYRGTTTAGLGAVRRPSTAEVGHPRTYSYAYSSSLPVHLPLRLPLDPNPNKAEVWEEARMCGRSTRDGRLRVIGEPVPGPKNAGRVWV